MMYMTYLVCVSVVQMGPAVFFFFFWCYLVSCLLRRPKACLLSLVWGLLSIKTMTLASEKLRISFFLNS